MTKLTLMAGVITSLALPLAAHAEMKASGEVLLGFGDRDGSGSTQAFVHTDVNVNGKFGGEGALTFGFSLDTDLDVNERTDDNIDITLDDLTLYLDFGSGGKLSYTTESRCFAGAVPWIDGDLIGHNTQTQGFGDSVHTRIGGKARCVGYNPAVIDAAVQPAPFGAKTNGYFKYQNSFGKLKTTFYLDPTEKATGLVDGSGTYDESETLVGMSQWEVELDYRLAPNFAGRVQYNELEDVAVWAILGNPRKEFFGFVRYEEQTANTGNNYRWTGLGRWSPKDLGVFKGLMAIYQADDSAEGDGYVVQANFGDKAWNASVAVDKDGDYAIEGEYRFAENYAAKIGYDSGCAAGDCFNANAGFGGAAAQEATWVFGVSMKF